MIYFIYTLFTLVSFTGTYEPTMTCPNNISGFMQLHKIAFTTARIILHVISFPHFICDIFHIYIIHNLLMVTNFALRNPYTPVGRIYARRYVCRRRCELLGESEAMLSCTSLHLACSESNHEQAEMLRVLIPELSTLENLLDTYSHI